MSFLITRVDKRSPAERAGLRAGERLVSVGGHPVSDVLDYQFYSYEPQVVVTVEDESGNLRTVTVKKAAGQDMGLNFETYLMDRPRRCANKCVFCFIDQLPRGMRETLYFKDDDARLSFLLGNYITLTNITDAEAKRIIDLRISPINISVHTTDPEKRSLMLGNKKGGESLRHLRAFAGAGLTLNCQIVLCPGLNDGEDLRKTLNDLTSLGVNSVSVVPVGLTRYRENLYPLRAVTPGEAQEAINIVSGYERVYASDELFQRAGLPVPPWEYYDEFPQYENGVGMLRVFHDEFREAAENLKSAAVRPFSVATGLAARDFLVDLLDFAVSKWHNIPYYVYGVTNYFFGPEVSVAGLVTGRDILEQLRGRDLGEHLFVPSVMLRDGGDVFLDDLSVGALQSGLGVRVIPVEPEASKFIEAIME
ncbi:MAG: DUF512 domain-containing protein [Oscillospiraceae bacterium]|jgi:putative radical SAM enzyme (TIGR03279 family)